MQLPFFVLGLLFIGGPLFFLKSHLFAILL